jgi:signal recognition particle subunit SRP54
MTPAERDNPKIINGSRRLRIAKGSGVTVSDVNQLVDRFFEARKMMSQMNLPGMRRPNSNRKNAKGKKGKRQSGRGPTPARVPANMQGFDPRTMGALPPGMQLPDLSKLNLPKE